MHDTTRSSQRANETPATVARRLLVIVSISLAAAAPACAPRAYSPPPADPILAKPPSRPGVTVPSGSPRGRGLLPATRWDRVSAGRATLVDTAAAMVGSSGVRVSGRRFRDDCSGFVEAVYSSVGLGLSSGDAGSGLNGVAIIHAHVGAHGRLHGRRPLPGDIVFFDGTHGPRGSRLTHVGIVERQYADGTVVFVHHMQGRVVRGRLNRDAPGLHRDPRTGRVLNDYLRRAGAGDRLAGQLFAGYGTLTL